MTLYIYWDIDPTIFPDLSFLRWYGICWAAGMIIAYQTLKKIYQREHIPLARLDKLLNYVLVGILLGMRLGHILFYDPIYYWNNPIEILPFRFSPNFEFTGLAGLASHGGFAGAMIALYVYTKKYKENFIWLLDRLAIGGAVLGGFIRIGNLMNSEIIGIPSEVPWAFVFSRIDQLPRHPSQIYEAIFYFSTYIITYLIWKNQKSRLKNGLIFGISISLIFTQRFFIEFLKENQVAFEEGLWLNMGQLLSIPVILLGLSVVVKISFVKSGRGY